MPTVYYVAWAPTIWGPGERITGTFPTIGAALDAAKPVLEAKRAAGLCPPWNIFQQDPTYSITYPSCGASMTRRFRTRALAAQWLRKVGKADLIPNIQEEQL